MVELPGTSLGASVLHCYIPHNASTSAVEPHIVGSAYGELQCTHVFSKFLTNVPETLGPKI